MNRSESPSTALRAPSPPTGGEGQDEGGYGSWAFLFRAGQGESRLTESVLLPLRIGADYIQEDERN